MFIPKSNNAIVAQNFYIAKNNKPLGAKNELMWATDGSGYSEKHKEIHPTINNYLTKFGYYDIFIVNLKGDIVYSVFKEVDFATNLLTGPYKQTNFAKSYKKSLNATNASDVAVEDFQFYKPSYNTPASFISSPIFDGDQKVGVLIFQMPVDNINAIMTGDEKWENDGLGKSGETYLVGSDLKMRSMSRFLREDKPNYLEAFKNAAVSQNVINNINHMETSILLSPINTIAAKQAALGQKGEQIIKDYRNISVLSAYAPLEMNGLKWSVVSEIDESEAFAPIYRIRNIILIVTLILAAIATLIANIFAKGFTKPILQLKTTFNKLALGVLPEPIVLKRKDEIGQTNAALNVMVDSLHNAADFALEIGEGKFDSDFEPKSEQDTLGNALTQMRDRLSEVALDEKKRSWGIEGLALFSDILRRDNDNLEALSNNLIAKMIEYLGANQGAIFVVHDDNQYVNDPILKLTGCYAYDRQKYLEVSIHKGEGLVGQCWAEGKKILLTDVPKQYINITSGLGEAPPNVILIVPLMVNGEILGIVELASFKIFQDYEVDFVEKVSESIASTLKSVKVNVRTVNLLNESKSQAEVMQQQEEEMRQNMEEMQATQEMFDSKEQDYKSEITALKKLIHVLNEKNK